MIGRDGIAGLSHRGVAAEADVPLGSLTYHFATLEELLVAALRQAGERGGVELGYELYPAALRRRSTPAPCRLG